MDLFAITCTTCKSRLKVRDPAAVGQILACPKCGGMVMVKPPPAWQEASEQKSDLPTAADVEGPRVRFDQTAHGSAFDMLEELLSDAPPKVQTPPPATAAAAAPAANDPPPPPKPRFVGGPPVKRSATPPPSAPKPNATPPTAAGPIPPPTKSAQSTAVAPSPTLPLAPSARQSITHADVKITTSPPGNSESTPSEKQPRARPRKPWMLMTGSIAAGILLAFTAVTAAIHLFRPADVGRPIVQRPASKIAKPTVSVATKSSATDAAPTASIVTAEPAQPAASDVPPEPTSEPTMPPPMPTPPGDPLGLVNNAPPAPTAPLATGDPLAKFDRILAGGADDPLQKSTAKPAVTASLPPPDAAPARPLAPRPPPRDIDIARRLADPLSGIETAPSGTALADFLQLMSDLSTIPITLDIPFVPITPESAVSLRMTNTTVGNALAEALRPLRLEYAAVDDQLVVRRAEPSMPRPVTVSVKDLIGGDEQQLTELTELLSAVVDPTAWGEGEDLGTITSDAARSSLTISHPRSVKFPIHVRLAIEKLRETRTPPLAHELKLDPIFFKLDTRSALARPRLDKLVSLNYSQPTRLLTILERLGSLAGVRILVDWRDVATAGWNPSGDATLVVRNEPLSTALDSLLTPLDLTWRIIDGQTLQVVTPARLAEQGELEIYKADSLLSAAQTGDALLARIRAALGESTFTAGGGNGEIRFDEPGKCLLAWLPQPKQRELEALLAKWRNKG